MAQVLAMDNQAQFLPFLFVLSDGQAKLAAIEKGTYRMEPLCTGTVAALDLEASAHLAAVDAEFTEAVVRP